MIIFDDLTEAQEHIIKEICLAQLNSLRRIYNNDMATGQDVKLLLIQNEVDEEKFIEILEEKIENFSKVNTNPKEFSKLSDDDLSSIRHILCNVEEQFKDVYPKAVKNLWNKLFLIEDFRTVNLN